MRIGVAVLARLGSTRLPRKMLADLGDGEMLVQRVYRLASLSGLATVVAVPTEDVPTFESVVDGDVYGGSESVLRRLFEVCRSYSWDAVIRVNGDCPDIDPQDIARVGEALATGLADYVSYHVNGRNAVLEKVGTPEGVTLEALQATLRECELMLEHATWSMYQPRHCTAVRWLATDKRGENVIDTADDLARWKERHAAVNR